MANKKITDLTELTAIADEDFLEVVDDPSGTPTSKKISRGNLLQKDTSTEHVTNGTFDTDLSGWTDSSTGTGSVAWNTGVVDVTRVDSGNQGRLIQEVTTIVGQVYELSASFATGSLHRIFIGTTIGGIEFGIIDLEVATFKATTTTTYITLNLSNTGTGGFDNVSVKAIQNLVENGEFSSDRAWTKGTGWSISSGTASSDGSQTAESALTQDIEIEEGQLYLNKIDLTARSAGNIKIYCGGNESGWFSTVGLIETFLVGGSVDTDFKIIADASFVGSMDDIEVYKLRVG